MIKWRKTKFAIWLGFFIMLILAFNFVSATNNLNINLNGASQSSLINVKASSTFNDIILSPNDSRVILYYPFSLNNILQTQDYTTYNNSGNLSLTIFNNSGYIGNTFTYDGVNSFIDVPSSSSLNFTANQSFTVSAWFYSSTTANKRYIVSDWSETGNTSLTNGWALSFNTGKPRFETTTSPNTVSNIQTAGTYSANAWHFITGVANATTMSLYVDGVNIGNSTYNGLRYDVNNIRIGYSIGGNGNNHFQGNIDQVILFNYDLSATDVNKLYTTSLPIFYNQGNISFSNLNLSLVGTENYINISLNDCHTSNGTSLQFNINNLSIQNFTNCNFINYSLGSLNPNNLTLNLILDSNSFNYYSPLVLNNITIKSMSIGDFILPNATILNPANNTYSNASNINFSVSATDNLNLSQAELYIYNSTGYLVVITNYSISGTSAQTSTVQNLYEGVFHFFYTIYDNAGNFFSTVTRYFTIDLTKPFIQLLYPQDFTFYDAPFNNLTFTTQDTNMDTCIFTNATSSYNINCSIGVYPTSSQEGINYWTLYANDSAGNQNTKNVTFWVDTTAPVGINPIKNKSIVYSGDTVLFSANWSDNLELTNYVFSINQTGDFINYGFVSFDPLDNISYAEILINASAGTVVHWSFTGYDSVGNSNATVLQSFTVQTMPTNLTVQTSKNIYPQGYSNSSGEPFLIDITANYTNIYNQEIVNASCILMANQKVIQTNLLYNSSIGLFELKYPTNNLYGNIVLDVNCSTPNTQSQFNEKNISVYYMMFANENENLTFDNNLSTSTYLSRDMPTTNDIYDLEKIINAVVGINLVQEFNYHAIGVNGSFQREYFNDGDFNLSTNISLSDTASCKPILCYFVKDYTFNKIYEDCGDTPQIYNLSNGVATQLNYNIVDEHTLAIGTYFGQSIYLNCSSPSTETINFYYNYSTEIPAISLSNAKPTGILSKIIASVQKNNNYTIGSNQMINQTRNQTIEFNNTNIVDLAYDYSFFAPIELSYPNSIIPNTVYIYNSTNGLLTTDNLNENVSNYASIIANGNVVLFRTEIIPANSVITETGIAKILHNIRDNETLISSSSNVKSWNIFVFSISSLAITNNLYIWSNYSLYSVNDSYNYIITKTENGNTSYITNFTIDTINKIINLPVINLSNNVSYNITAYTNLPLINYELPTPLNLSSVASFIPVNVSTIDLNNFTTSIYLYNSTLNLIDQINSSNSIFYYEFNNFSNGQYSFNVSSCNILLSCNVLPMRTVNFDNKLVKNLTLSLGISQYPYLSVSENYPIDVTLKLFNTIVDHANVTMTIYAPTGVNTSFSLLYNNATGTYQNSINITQVGDYGFLIMADAHNIGKINSTGIFLVRSPFTIQVKLYKQSDQSLIKNDFAYITAEYVGTRTINPILENFLNPLRTNYPSTFHAPYINGLATLTLYEPTNYVFRYMDGQIIFDGQYSPPNITKTYTVNTYLGTENLNGTSALYQFVLSDADLHPYRALFNWGYILLIVGAIIVTLVLFFIMPSNAVVTFFLGLGFIIMLTLLRVIVWFWLGN